MVNTYTVRMNTELKILEFREMTEQWLDFIISCRHGEAHDYDIVIGAMANDQINFCSPEAIKCLEFVSCEEVIR